MQFRGDNQPKACTTPKRQSRTFFLFCSFLALHALEFAYDVFVKRSKAKLLNYCFGIGPNHASQQMRKCYMVVTGSYGGSGDIGKLYVYVHISL